MAPMVPKDQHEPHTDWSAKVKKTFLLHLHELQRYKDSIIHAEAYRGNFGNVRNVFWTLKIANEKKISFICFCRHRYVWMQKQNKA